MRTSRTASRATHPTHRRTALLAPCVALLIAGGALPPASAVAALAAPSPTPAPAATMPPPAPTRIPSPLKPIKPAAFQAVVDRAAKEADGPRRGGTAAALQGTFREVTGTSELGTAKPPGTGDHSGSPRTPRP